MGRRICSADGVHCSGKRQKANFGPKEMNVSDFLQRLRLDDVWYLLNSGHPPIIVQLLCINTLLMIVFIFKRMRRQSVARRHTSYIIQWLLLFSCFAVVCEEQWLPAMQRGEASAYDHLTHMVGHY